MSEESTTRPPPRCEDCGEPMPAKEWAAWQSIPGVTGDGFGRTLGPMYHCGCVRRAEEAAQAAGVRLFIPQAWHHRDAERVLQLLEAACEKLDRINANLERHLAACEKLIRPPGVPHSNRGEKRKR